MSMTHPESGARFLFERIEAGEEGARYRVTVYLPDGESLRLRIVIDAETGAISIAEGESEPPRFIAAQIRSLGRTLYTQGARGPRARWPRRMLRWRAADRGR